MNSKMTFVFRIMFTWFPKSKHPKKMYYVVQIYAENDRKNGGVITNIMLLTRIQSDRYVAASSRRK